MQTLKSIISRNIITTVSSDRYNLSSTTKEQSVIFATMWWWQLHSIPYASTKQILSIYFQFLQYKIIVSIQRILIHKYFIDSINCIICIIYCSCTFETKISHGKFFWQYLSFKSFTVGGARAIFSVGSLNKP